MIPPGCRIPGPVFGIPGLGGDARCHRTEVLPDPGSCLFPVLVGFQIHFLVFHRPPQPLDEQIVAVAASAVYADLNARALQNPGEFLTGELGALVGVEDVQSPLPGRASSRAST